MRISDWSSDVCSSDLTGCGRPCARMAPAPSFRVAATASEPSDTISTATVAGTSSKMPSAGSKTSVGSPHATTRSEEHTSELQSLMRISYAVFCLKKKKRTIQQLHVLYIQYQTH